MTDHSPQKTHNGLVVAGVSAHGSHVQLVRRDDGSHALAVEESRDGVHFSTLYTGVRIATTLGLRENLSLLVDASTASFGDDLFLTYTLARRSGVTVGAWRKGQSAFRRVGKLPTTQTVRILSGTASTRVMTGFSGGTSLSILHSEDRGKTWTTHEIPLPQTHPVTVVGAFSTRDAVHVALAWEKDHAPVIGVVALTHARMPELINAPRVLFSGERGDRPVGVVFRGGDIVSYWQKPSGALVAYRHVLPRVHHTTPAVRMTPLVRVAHNPILMPNPRNRWESVAVLNSAALELDGGIHLIYRAVGDGDISVLGYAFSPDGVTITERLPLPIYMPSQPFEGCRTPRTAAMCEREAHGTYDSGGGGYGGCEDPRITRIGDRIYLIYVAFNGYPETNIALTSISVDDFRARRWEKWKKPVLITSLDVDHKNPDATKEFLQDRPWYKKEMGIGHKGPAILPEKVDGKYVIFHRIFPNIVIDAVDDLDAFDGKKFLRGEKIIPVRKDMWDSHKISIGSTPIKTNDGWLVFYNAVGKKDMSRYKIGAALLDLKDPSKVLYRTREPVLVPETDYENCGHKFGVVFTTGAVLKDGTLYVYYGGSDMVICVATVNCDEFVQALKETGSVEIQTVTGGAAPTKKPHR